MDEARRSVNLQHLTTLIVVDEPYRNAINGSLVERAARTGFDVGVATLAGRFREVLDNQSWQVSVRVTGEDEMQRLNRDFRGVDRSTDVLSFSTLHEAPGLEFRYPEGSDVPLGEIAVSYPHIRRQAVELGHSTDTELAWLLIHGMLQLLGYTHEDDADAELMERLEQDALRQVVC